MQLHTDPVCRMKVQDDLAQGKYEYRGKTYYFCTKGCMEKFIKEPEKYVKEKDNAKKG